MSILSHRGLLDGFLTSHDLSVQPALLGDCSETGGNAMFFILFFLLLVGMWNVELISIILRSFGCYLAMINDGVLLAQIQEFFNWYYFICFDPVEKLVK